MFYSHIKITHLPPVPRRNSKTQLNINSNLNLNSIPKQLKNVGSGITTSNAADDYYQTIDFKKTFNNDNDNEEFENKNPTNNYQKTRSAQK